MDNFTAHIGPKTTPPPPTTTTTASLRQQPTLPLQDIHYNIALNGRSEGSKLLSSPAKQSDPVDRSFVDRQIADRPLGDRQREDCPPLGADHSPSGRFTAELPRTEPVRTHGSAKEAEIRVMPSLHQTGSSLASPAETGYYAGGSPWPPSQSSEAAPCRTMSSSSSSLHAPCGSWSPSSPSVGR
jgi:hypothetical protein